MDEKDLSNIPKRVDEVPEPDHSAGQTADTGLQDTPVPESPAANAVNTEEPAQEQSQWQFDAQVETDISKMDFSYSGKEIEIVAPLLKEEPVKNDDTITISKTKVRRTFKIMGIVLAAILGVGLIVAGVVYSFFLPNHMELMTPVNTALNLDGTQVSVGAYNYYYNSFTSDKYLTNYESYGLDTSVAFDKQYYDESTGETWADYFENNAIEELRYVIYYYNCAKDAGMKLSADEKKQLDEAMDSVVSAAQTAGQTTNQYLQEQFGEYVGLKTIRKMQEQRYLAQKYVQQLSATQKITAEEVDKFYQESPEKLETASFRYLPIPYTESNKEEMRAKSEELKGKLTDAATFTEVAKPYAEEAYQDYITDDYTLIANITSVNDQIPGDIREWLFTDEINVNDTAIVDNTDQSCFYVVMMVETPHLNEEMLFSIRHLLVKVESSTDADGKTVEPTAEQWKACEEKAQKYLDEYNKTDKSELAFAKLADEKSEDTASTSAAGSEYYGGLLAQQSTGKLVAEFENWCLDAARKYGDVGLVKTQYGYHLIYYISNQEAWKYTAETEILGQRQDENVEKTTCDKKMGFSKRAVAKPVSEEGTSSAGK